MAGLWLAFMGEEKKNEKKKNQQANRMFRASTVLIIYTQTYTFFKSQINSQSINEWFDEENLKSDEYIHNL